MHSLWKKAFSMERKTPKIKFCHKRDITSEKVKIIEIILPIAMLYNEDI